MDKVIELKRALTETWAKAYELEQSGAIEEREFYAEIAHEINDIELKVMKYERGIE